MAVRVLKHETRCKLCVHEKAPLINALLERRSKREKDDSGDQINLEYVLAKFAEWGVVNPNQDNVKSHLKKHIEFLSDAKVEEENAEAAEIVRQLSNGEIEFADLDEGLRFLATVYLEQQKAKFSRGEDLGITHDHFLKLVGEATKRKTNDAQTRLLDALGGGIGRVFEKALGGGDKLELDPAPDADKAELAEVIAVEDGD